MPLTPSTSFTQDVDDVHEGVVEDTTSDYDTGGNPARGDAANYLLWAKTDQNGARTFDNPEFGNVLTIMSWVVATLVSGWYERILMRIQLFDEEESYLKEVQSGGIVTVYPGIVYYSSTNKVYRCITNSTGNLPTDTDYFEEVTDLSELISNTNVSVTISNTYVRSTVDDAMKSLFRKMGRDCACDDQENQHAYKMDGLLIAADSEVNGGNYDEMEKIIAYLESQLSQLN